MAAASLAAGGGLGWLAERYLADPARRGRLSPPPMPAADRELGVTAADGTRLHVEVRGPAQAPTIVLAHGWTKQIAVWRHQLAALSGRWRVVAYDQRGHGRSTMPADGDWSAHALGRDLRGVIEATAPAGERCVVVGHSMGGMALLALAESEPEWTRQRVAGSVLLSTGASELWRRSALCGGSAALAAVGRPLVPWLLGPRGPVGPVADLMYYSTRLVALGPDAAPSAVAEVERMVLACPPHTRAMVARMLAAMDLSAGISRVPGPVQVLVGERDRLTPPDHSRELAAGRDDAELVVLPGVGHITPLEAPERVSGCVEAVVRAALAPEGAGAPTGAAGDLARGREAAGD